MQRGGNRRAGFFDDPFGNFGIFGGGFDGQSGLFPSMFGGRDPFDDPFFRQPFGSMFGSGMFGGSMLGPSIFSHSPFTGLHPPGFFLEHEEAPPQAKKSRGPIIEEILSEEEKEEESAKEAQGKGKEPMNDNSGPQPRKGNRELVLQETEADGRGKQTQPHGNGSRVGGVGSLQQQYQQQQPRSQSFTFQSSTVTYGGVNGAYYTSSTSRRTGSDGMSFEEMKAADSSTGQAAHRVSRAIHGKGHSLTRKLNSDGRVESRQTLHNLNQGEMGGFENAWNANGGRMLQGSGSAQIERGSGSGRGRRGWALPASEQPHQQQERPSGGNGGTRAGGGGRK